MSVDQPGQRELAGELLGVWLGLCRESVAGDPQLSALAIWQQGGWKSVGRQVRHRPRIYGSDEHSIIRGGVEPSKTGTMLRIRTPPP